MAQGRGLDRNHEPWARQRLTASEEQRQGQEHQREKQDAEGAVVVAFVEMVMPKPGSEAVQRRDADINQQRPMQRPGERRREGLSMQEWDSGNTTAP